MSRVSTVALTLLVVGAIMQAVALGLRYVPRKPEPEPTMPHRAISVMRWEREDANTSYQQEYTVALPCTVQAGFWARKITIEAPGDSILGLAVFGRGPVTIKCEAWR